MSTDAAASRSSRTFKILLGLSTALVAVVCIVQLTRDLLQLQTLAGSYGHTSGVWTTLASDFAHGDVYRPLGSGLGYGGTRYFPLPFVVHGVLMVAGLGPIEAGTIASLGAMALLLWGVFRLMRQHDVSPLIAVSLTVLLLPLPATQIALTTIRGDALPAALNVWALVLVTGPQPRTRAGGLLFALAFLAKVSTIFGVLAVLTVWWGQGDRARCIRLAITTGSIVVLGAIAFLVASDGYWIQSMRATGSGDTSWLWIIKAPVSMMRLSAPLDIVVVVMGLGAVVAAPRELRRSVLGRAFLLTTGVVFLLFCSPGVVGNHLLDVHVAAVVMIGVLVKDSQALQRFALVLGCGVGVLAISTGVTEQRVPTKQIVERVLERLPREGGPLLSENPWIPLLAGERPYLLDPFSFRVASQQAPKLARDLGTKLRRKFFRAVVLIKPLDADSFWGGHYTATHFGEGFVEALQANYRYADHLGEYPTEFWVYLPITDSLRLKGEANAVFFTDAGFRGSSSELAPGKYDLSKNPIPNFSLSSLQVGPKARVRICERAETGEGVGECHTYEPNARIGSVGKFNDRTSYIEVIAE